MTPYRPIPVSSAFSGYRVAVAAKAFAPALGVETLRGESMGTGWSVKYWGSAASLPSRTRVEAVIDASLRCVIEQMSTWDASSVLSRFNAADAGTSHPIPAEMTEVLVCALDVAQRTDGAFDPTIGPLVNLWGFGPRDRSGDAARRKPDADQLAAARERCGIGRIAWDASGLKQPGGLYIDLSAIAKGFAVDLVSTRLGELGMPDHLVEVGGELRATGVRPDGSPWRVAVASPGRDRAIDGPAALLDVALVDMSIATSGDNWHYFADEHAEYAHTLDPRTGCPVKHDLASVTVLHESCMHADALATALTVLGPEEGFRFALGEDLAALFVRRADDGFEERMTPRFDALQRDGGLQR
jgi:thiamine biosynthesis lipoprotein